MWFQKRITLIYEKLHKVYVNKNFRSWEKIVTGVTQGSVSGPLLFNIFINDLFLLVSNSYLSNYADEKTLDIFGLDLEEVKNVLRAELNEVTRWFYENYMSLNAGKYHFSCFRKYTPNETSIFKNSVMNTELVKKYLGFL